MTSLLPAFLLGLACGLFPGAALAFVVLSRYAGAIVAATVTELRKVTRE